MIVSTGKAPPEWFTVYCAVQDKGKGKGKAVPEDMIPAPSKGKGKAAPRLHESAPTHTTAPLKTALKAAPNAPGPSKMPAALAKTAPAPVAKTVPAPDKTTAPATASMQPRRKDGGDVEMEDMEAVVKKVGEMTVAKTATAAPPSVSPVDAPPAAAPPKDTRVPLEKGKAKAASKGDKKLKVSNVLFFIFIH